MIKYKGHSIAPEFAGINKPDRFVVRRLSACGTVGMSLLGSFATEDAAKAAIDAAQPLTADTITDDLRVSHCGAHGAYVGLIKRGNEVVWRCPHKHTNRDSDTRNTAARSCAGLVLEALRNPDGVRAHIKAMQLGVPHFQYEWQKKEWQFAIARREWSLEAAAEILNARRSK